MIERTTVFLLTVSTLLAVSPSPPQAAQEPVLRPGGGYTVLVDAVVTDSKNRVVSDLSAEDFVLYEDDVPQKIDTFRLFAPEPEVSAAPSGEAEAAVSTDPRPVNSAIGPRRNLIVFLLDYATTEFTNQKLVEEACEKYIRENLRPNDFVAVFSLGASFQFLQDFTNDRELLMAALKKRGAAGEALASNPATPTPGTPSEASVEPIGVTADSPGGFAAAGQAAQAQGSGQADLMLAQRIQELYYTMSSYLGKREARAVLSAIQAIAEGVGGIEGRKTLFLFSQGFVVGGDVESDLERTISRANRANLAVYGVDSQGLATRTLSGSLVPGGELSSISAATGRDRIRATGGESLFDRARQVGSDVRDSSLRYISSATGGFAIRNTNDLHVSMERVDEEIRSYYLMSYRPTSPDFDGEFRKIRVEVKRKGLSVRARSGYMAVPPGMEMFSGDEYQLLRDVEAGKIASSLPVFFRLDRFHSAQGRQTALLTLEIPGEEIRFDPVEVDGEQKHQARLSILGLVRKGDGSVATRFGSPVNLSATEGERDMLRQGAVSFSNPLALDPGLYSFEVVVQDLNAGRTGRAGAGLRLSQPEAGRLSLSSIVLGKQVEASATEGGGLDFEGTRILPSAARRFKRSDRLVYYFSVYNFQTEPSQAPRLQVAVTVSPSGAPAPMALPEYRLNPTTEGAASTSKYIELESLAPGSYFLSALVTDLATGQKVTGRTSFQIVE